MIKRLLIGAFFCANVLHAENLLDNSSMDSTTGWKGDRKFVEVDGNRAISVEANKSRKLGFTQESRTRGKKELYLKFRYKTGDYQGNGIDVRASNQVTGAVWYTIKAKADGQWQQVSLRFLELDKNPTTTIAISLNKGEGTVLFDDISLDTEK